MHMLPRAEAWGCSACGNTNFVILASTLHNIGWLPVHSSSYGLAMALRLKLANRLSHFHPELLAQGGPRFCFPVATSHFQDERMLSMY